jgi:uncharacterized protein YegL
MPVSAAPSLRRHGAWAWCAVGLSVLLHALLLSRLPVLLVGAMQKQPLFPDYPAIALDRVERIPRPQVVEPDRFRPENPGEIQALWADTLATPSPAAPDLPVPEMPEVSTGPVKGEAEVLVEPEAPSSVSSWDPRQDILQIENPQWNEQDSAMPRRWSTAAERTDSVPDVVLPVEPSAHLAMSAPAGLPAGIESLSRPTVRADGLPDGAAAASLDLQPAEPGYLVLPRLEEAALPEEPRALEPVEGYLTIATRSYRAPDEPDYLYLEINITRKSAEALPILSKDVLFVQDCSESMTPWKLAECKRGLIRWLDQLNPGDRFDVLAFRDQTTRCFGEWQAFTPVSQAAALAFIDGLRAQGNTDVFASLQAALSVPEEPGRPVIMALITDGRPTTGETEGSAIIEGFTLANQGRLSVFGLGGGQRVNRFLLDLLSYRNRGDVVVEEQTDQIPYAMERLGAATRRPVLSELSYQFSGVEAAVVYPSTLTHLYLDRPLTLYARVPADQPSAAFQVVGRSGGNYRDMVFPLEVDQSEAGTADIRARWVRHRLYEWIGSYLRMPRTEDLTRIQNLADRYGLAVPYGFGTAVPRW